jgi:hypothetical protein
VRREQVVEVLRAALEPLAFVNAASLGGSDAFGLRGRWRPPGRHVVKTTYSVWGATLSG